MKTCTKPCNQCPFRRTALPGYVGSTDPADFIATTMADDAMPCHTSIDYEDPDWRDQLDPLNADSTARHCAGAATFFANIGKLSRDRMRPRLKSDKVNVFASPNEFLAHHAAAYGRVMGESRRPSRRKRLKD